MRKIFVFFILFSFLLVSSAYCLENYNRWRQSDRDRLLMRELPYDFIHLGHARGGETTVTTTTTAIPTGYGLVKLVCATSAKTLANGTPGQVMHIVAVDQTGTATITPATSTGWAFASLDADGETLTLQYIDDTYGWIVTGYQGTTITGKNSGP